MAKTKTKRKDGLIAWADSMPWILKLILCIPALDIFWAIYRIYKGVRTGNMVMLIVGILWIVPGAAFLWLVDLISTILFKRPRVCA